MNRIGFSARRALRSLATGLLLLWSGLALADSGYVFGPDPNTYPVGLQVLHQYDYSRSFRGNTDVVTGLPTKGEQARPMQILVWFPSLPGGKPIRYRDYVALGATESGFDSPNEKSRQFNKNARALAAVADQPMRASWNPAAAPGRFPVVIYAPSFGASSFENADLCEYLAGHGYMVISSASMGAASRIMTGDLEGVEAQVEDIGYLIAFAHSLPGANIQRLAVVGYSWGGLANVAAAAKDKRIRAIASLDGTVRYDNETVRSIAYLSPSKIDIPFLYIASHPVTLEQLNTDKKYYDISWSFLNELKFSDLYLISMAAMEHEDFSSYFLRVLPEPPVGAPYSREEAIVSHKWVARYLERFLDAYLRDDTVAKKFLNADPVANGVPRHFMKIDVRKPTIIAPTLENISRELDQQGFDQADKVISDLHLDQAGSMPPEDILNDWGHRVLYSGNSARAIQVFGFAIRLYPQSAMLRDGLGEAFQVGNDPDQAALNYRLALQLDPTNRAATTHLRAMTKSQ